MTINNIVIKNIKGNLNKYAMYYLSNVIVVTIFLYLLILYIIQVLVAEILVIRP